MGKVSLFKRIAGSKNILGRKNFIDQKNLLAEFISLFFDPKIFLDENKLGPKFFQSKKIFFWGWVNKIFGSKKFFGSKIFSVEKFFWLKLLFLSPPRK